VKVPAASADDRTTVSPAVSAAAIAAVQRDQSLSAELTEFAAAFRRNGLLDQSKRLLTVMHALRNRHNLSEVTALQRQLCEEISRFDAHIRNAGAAPEIVASARYLLCSAIDEAAVNTTWGAEANWSQHSLLSTFHNEASGGEKFFTIVERLVQTPAQYLDLIELAYVILSLGFEGKYRAIPNGRDLLEHVRGNLFSTLEKNQPAVASDLSRERQAPARQRQHLTRLVPLWVVCAAFLALTTLSYVGIKFWLGDHAADTQARIDQISEHLNR
jgi:type VI secretion system protein ImpK